jgi:transposase
MKLDDQKARNRHIAKLYVEGNNTTQIAARMGLKRETISRILGRLGFDLGYARGSRLAFGPPVGGQ